MSDRHNDLTPAARSNARLGIVLFLIYLLIYCGFVLLSAFAPATMARPVIGQVNLAIVYGLALIALALLLALVYVFLCKPERRDQNGGGQ